MNAARPTYLDCFVLYDTKYVDVSLLSMLYNSFDDLRLLFCGLVDFRDWPSS